MIHVLRITPASRAIQIGRQLAGEVGGGVGLMSREGRMYSRTHLPILGEVASVLQRDGFLERRHMGACFLVQNRKECPRQEVHVNYPPDFLEADPKPLNFLLSLQHETGLIVRAGKSERIIYVPEGCALVFEGDIPHAGIAYSHPHSRLFGFVPTKGLLPSDIFLRKETQPESVYNM